MIRLPRQTRLIMYFSRSSERHRRHTEAAQAAHLVALRALAQEYP